MTDVLEGLNLVHTEPLPKPNPEMVGLNGVAPGDMTIKEQDPTGKDAHEPGAKLDAGKLRPYLVYNGFKHALSEVWKDGTYGANKYSDNGWKKVPNAKERYLDAFFRHFDKWNLYGEIVDSESKVHHLGACVWCLLAVLELELTND